MGRVSAPTAPVAREPRRPRRRGAAESLGSIVLAFESIVVFLGGLVAYGLKTLPAGVEQWWGIVAGAVARTRDAAHLRAPALPLGDRAGLGAAGAS